jgi:HAD superfamily hydrolase (TIGR01509 family)
MTQALAGKALQMTQKALLFGSIGTLVETSELQRLAFNEAFAEAGLNWEWDVESYREMLTQSGGKRRIADYAAARGETVNAAASHRRKTELFDAIIETHGLQTRPGVLETIAAAKDQGFKLGFATSTSAENVAAIFRAVGMSLQRSDFDFVGDASMVDQPKPHPEIYELALRETGASADQSVAIEDTAVSMQAAKAAGIRGVAFPGAYADPSAFDSDVPRLQQLSPKLLSPAASEA